MCSKNLFNTDDVLVIKKKLGAASIENQQLKVKLTKSLNDITKKDKKIEKLVDPNESTLFVKKAVYENKVAEFMSMREANRKLERKLFIKDVTIKKLQNDLQITKKHSCTFGTVSYKGSSYNYLPQNLKNRNLKPKSSLSTSRTSTSLVSKEKIQVHPPEDDDVTKQRYSSIIDNFLNPPSNTLAKDIKEKVVPESDLERNELRGTVSLDELTQLESNYLDVLDKVNNLKAIVSDLKHEQNKAVDLIEESSNGKTLKQLENSRTSVHPSETQESSSLNNKRDIKNLPKIQSCKNKDKSPYLCTLSKRPLKLIKKKASKHEYLPGTGEEETEKG